MVEIATWGVRLLGFYAALGLAFSVPFLMVGVKRIDPVAAESTRGFRIMIFPGVVALWPFLLRRWASGAQPMERNAHRLASLEETR